MFVPSVFVEFKSLAYIVINRVEECIFTVYLCSLCRCIPGLTQRRCHFRLCIWAEGWYRQQSKGRGHGLKTQGRSFPTKPQTHPTAGVDQAKCVGPRQDKRELFLARRTHSGWESHRWHGVKGHVAGETAGPRRYWTLLAHFLNTVRAVRQNIKMSHSSERHDSIELKMCWLSQNLTQSRNSDTGRIIWDIWTNIFKQRMQIVFMNLWMQVTENIKSWWSACEPSLTWIIKSVDVAHASHPAIIV